ncbi:hypothetical protein F5888DRAFT_1602133 [Russula emetica]|nr:hypothetical protein F5888DRAFT_1602133 [Russula emetica]
MPKISIAKQDSASGPMTSASHPNVLRRNQACHQCRRRKLKCDAQRPCSTCVRSHAHALSHAPAGVNIPEHPECTFDEVPSTAVAQEVPKNRYEKLENRINELEAMLKDQTSSAPSKSSPSSLSPASAQSQPSPLSNYAGLTNATISTPSSTLLTPDFGLGQDYQPSSLTFTDVASPLKSFISPVDNHPEEMKVPATAAAISEIQGDTTSFFSEGFGYDVMWPAWPRDLPSPSLVRHLVETFFAFHPHASRLFHVSTFVTTLDLPPNHPKFPSPCILHAICAVGSLYTMAVPPTPLPDKNMGAHEIFGGRHRQNDYVDSFAEKQVKLAKQTSEEQLWAGRKLLEGVQALLIITWWYWCHARYAFMTIAQAIRAAIPLGLNVESPFSPLSDSIRTPSLILPPESVVEEEVRRNTFWLLYAMERMGGCSNGWPLSLDDQDVSQLLPMSGFNFELGASWSGSERQLALGKDILLLHPEDQVDSFNLYIKGTMLLSRVKAFNIRFRGKRFMGDPAYIYSPTYAEVWEKDSDGIGDVTADPRRTPAFIEIDHIASMFRQSFPLHLRNPIRDGCVDSHLYSASLIPHLAIILLHDPYAHIHSAGCVSAFKILEASRNILELIYAVCSTSFDVTLLDFFCTFAWFMAGRVLGRFWQAALDANSAEQVLTLCAEVEYIMAALAKLAERVPLASQSFL